MKSFLKKYWWIALPLPLIILYWAVKKPAPPSVPAAGNTETGNPASDANNPANQPGGPNNPTP